MESLAQKDRKLSSQTLTGRTRKPHKSIRILPSRAPLVDGKAKTPSERITRILASMREAVELKDDWILGKDVERLASLMRECANGVPEIKLYREGLSEWDWNYSVRTHFAKAVKRGENATPAEATLIVSAYGVKAYENNKDSNTFDAEATFTFGGNGVLNVSTVFFNGRLGSKETIERKIWFGTDENVFETAPRFGAKPLAVWLCSLIRLPSSLQHEAD